MRALKGEKLVEIPPVAVQPWGFVPPQGNECDIDPYSWYSDWECGVTGIFDPCDSRVTSATPCSPLQWSATSLCRQVLEYFLPPCGQLSRTLSANINANIIMFLMIYEHNTNLYTKTVHD